MDFVVSSMFITNSKNGPAREQFAATRCDVLLVSDDEPTAVQICRIAEQREETDLVRCRDLARLAERLEKYRGKTVVVLVDVDPSPHQHFLELEPMISRFTAARFVIVSESMESVRIIEAMQIGARHYLAKPKIADEMLAVINRLAYPVTDGGQVETGSVVSVLSAGGGCGATTIAINLAHELRELEDAPTLIADLDNAYGGIGTFFGVQGEYGIADVLDYGGSIDGHLIRSTMIENEDRPHALISPVSTNYSHPPGLRLDRMGEFIAAAKATFPWTVLDIPRLSPDRLAELVDLSRTTLIVTQMSVKDLWTARAIWAALNERGVAVDTVRFVINRYRKRGNAIDLAEAQRALNELPITLIANDFRAASDCTNLGKPLASCAPRSVLRKDVRKLAESILATKQAGETARQYQGVKS